MIDARALTWRHLLPLEVDFETGGAPEALRAALATLSRPASPRVLVQWNPAGSPRTLDGFAAIVARNPARRFVAGARSSGFVHGSHFAVLPGLGHARLFAPLRPARAAAAALRLYRPGRRRARVARAIAHRVARLGMPLPARDRVVVLTRARPPLSALLASSTGLEEVHLAISPGTPGPARKPTIAAFTSEGRLVAIAKLADGGERSSRLLTREAAMLRSLEERSALPGLAPRLLFEGEVGGTHVLVQSALEGDEPGLDSTMAHRRFLARLQLGPSRTAATSGLIVALRRRLRLLRSDLLPRMDETCTTLERYALPSTVVHGDFAPWNLVRHGDEVAAFDWEYGCLEGLPLLDDLHHELQVGFLLRGWTPARARHEALRVAVDERYPSELAHALVALYALWRLGFLAEEGAAADNAWMRRYEAMLHGLDR